MKGKLYSWQDVKVMHCGKELEGVTAIDIKTNLFIKEYYLEMYGGWSSEQVKYWNNIKNTQGK